MSPKTLIRQWVETFNRIDIDGLAAMYHEDAINHQVNTEPLYGREAIRQMFLHNAVSDIGKNRTHIIDGTLDEDTIFDHILKIITLKY